MVPLYTTYLIDLDGVVYRGESLLPGASAFIRWLDAHHKKYLFLTNNSFASEAQVLAKLLRLGVQTDETHVLGAAQAAVQYIAHRFPGACVSVVGEEPLLDLLDAFGLKVAAPSASGADVLLVGLDRAFDYQKLRSAIHVVQAGATFIAINRDPLLPVAGTLIPGTGTIVAAIETGSGVTPEVIGKPEPRLLDEAMRKLESTPDETVMIGDNLGVDILAGQKAGTHTLLVLSGKDTRASLAKSSIQPDSVYADLAALLSDLESSQGEQTALPG